MKPTLWDDGTNVIRGMMMGAADVVPGVSGGTVALVVGIYERLIAAISHFDLRLFKHLKHREFRKAAEHIDLRFLCSLGLGIGLGILAMVLVVGQLLMDDRTRPFTMAAFFGMILASGLLVARLIRPSDPAQRVKAVLLGVAGAAFAFGLTLLQSSSVEPSLPYLFLCGAIGICAMILPGVSGAMMLLLLGVYTYLTHIPKMLIHGEEVSHCVVVIAVFGAGCATGLLSFSKLLRWLLKHRHGATMAALCGFMFGALPQLWPFQIDRTPGVEKLKEKDFDPYLPGVNELMTLDTLAILATVLVSLVAVFLVERFSRPSLVSHSNSVA